MTKGPGFRTKECNREEVTSCKYTYNYIFLIDKRKNKRGSTSLRPAEKLKGVDGDQEISAWTHRGLLGGLIGDGRRTTGARLAEAAHVKEGAIRERANGPGKVVADGHVIKYLHPPAVTICGWAVNSMESWWEERRGLAEWYGGTERATMADGWA